MENIARNNRWYNRKKYIIGDLNGRVGNQTAKGKDIIGKHGEEKLNENGRMVRAMQTKWNCDAQYI